MTPFLRRFGWLLFLVGTAGRVLAQPPTRQLPAGEILLGLQKLNVLGTALYLAAHPDDENTAMIAYLANERLVRTAYLSLTRGDGGQNLIGPEQGELLGLIRTQELLQARRTDGGEQFFTRANDFGFSKSTDEALRLWGKENTLADVVRIVRQLQPDVIICRFPPDARAGHGHHSASAVLAMEAFRAAADPRRFPEQLAQLKPWQVKRVVWNTFSPSFTNNPPDTGRYVRVNLGGYNPLLGKSNTEVAGESRSMHKSQGFGSARNRGVRVDYLVPLAGPVATNDVFDGVDVTWQRATDLSAADRTELSGMFADAARTFRPDNPAATVPALLRAYQKMQTGPLAQHPWIVRKRAEVVNLLVACAGLWVEANAATYAGTPAAGTPAALTKVTVNVVKRSDCALRLDAIHFVGATKDTLPNLTLANNQAVNLPFTVPLSPTLAPTQPYWLDQPHPPGSYVVSDPQLTGLPERTPEFAVELTFSFDSQPLTLRTPVTFKRTDPVEGEVYRPFEIRPEVSATVAEKVYVFADQQPKTVSVVVKAGAPNATGEVSLTLPGGWKATPASAAFALKNAFDEQTVAFEVTAPAGASEGKLVAVAKTAKGIFTRGIRTIDYRHIPTQTLFPPAEATLVRLDIRTRGTRIGYLAGAGDEVPAALKQIGYQVTLLTEAELGRDLAPYDAIVVGVRAYNTEDRLRFYREKLMDYVRGGGNLVVQYQNERGLLTSEIGPYPFKIARARVTVEDAPITFLLPDSPLLNQPNKLTERDFSGWVQERGLSFAEKWDAAYQPIVSCHDPGEEPQRGGLLLARFGKGTFIYTGLSFFRQLPAGVPGAYRLFANLLAANIPVK